MSNQELMSLRRAMDLLFQDSLDRMSGTERNGNRYREQHLVPRADAWETDDEVLIQMALPGVDSENVDVTFEQDMLTIQGSFEGTDREGQHILSELPRGQFRRRFTLQVPVDVDKVEASYQNGLLTLHLPKSERVKPRKISVNAS